MNKRLERLKKEEENNRKKRGNNTRRMLLPLVFCVGIMFLGGNALMMQHGSVQAPAAQEQLLVEDDLTTDGPDWRLLIVSPAHILDRSFTVSLYEVEGKKVDVRSAYSLIALLDAAREAGVELTLCSTYRNVSAQRRIYERKVNYYKDQGYSEEESLTLAGEYVQPPGASEHHTGLAVDFFGGDPSLTEAFAQTPAYEWLQAHAAEYGFVERYPEDKEDVTGIGWEPWHYRYVGKTHAAVMTAEGLCLEEYAAQLSDNGKQAS